MLLCMQLILTRLLVLDVSYKQGALGEVTTAS